MNNLATTETEKYRQTYRHKTHAHMYAFAHMNTYTHMYILSHVHTLTGTHTCTHARTHTHTHTSDVRYYCYIDYCNIIVNIMIII